MKLPQLRHGLTPVEVLVSLALLSLVAGACVSWLTTVSQSVIPSLDGRSEELRLAEFRLALQELELRTTDQRALEIDQKDRLLIPTRWWVVHPSSGRSELSVWARLELDALDDQLTILFLDEARHPVGERRVLLSNIDDWRVEPVASVVNDRSLFRIRVMDSEGRTREWLVGSEREGAGQL